MLLAGSSAQSVTQKELVSQTKFGNFWLKLINIVLGFFVWKDNWQKAK